MSLLPARTTCGTQRPDLDAPKTTVLTIDPVAKIGPNMTQSTCPENVGELFWDTPVVATCYHLGVQDVVPQQDMEVDPPEASSSPPPVEVGTPAGPSSVPPNGQEEASVNAEVPKLSRRKNKKRYTLYHGDESPVLHLLRYINECCGEHPDLGRLRRCFWKSLGPVPSAWYRQPAVQAAKSWIEMQDLFLLRFFSRCQKRPSKELMKWGRRENFCFINK